MTTPTSTAAPPIAVAMSGGVDSSTVAAMLHAEGAPIVGLTMQLWDQRRLAGAPGMAPTGKGRCCSTSDVYDARAVATQLGIAYYVVNYEDRFERDVVRNFVEQYAAGRTPIPCSLCNTAVKFDQLLVTARQIGAEQVATGHYARVGFNPASGRYELRRAVDEAKDQTFFLWGLNQEQLSRARFPLGSLTKPEVRARAAALGLATANKPDSNEICFVPGNDYGAFLEAYAAEQGAPLADTSGEVVSTDGTVLARHGGVHRFTVGQRKGLGVARGEPLYVIQLDPERRQVVVGDDTALYAHELRASRSHWISGEPPGEPVRVQARIRNRHTPAPAWAEPLPGNELRVRFDEPQRAITPGQTVVLYQEDLVLGGAWIDSRTT
ncbi:MAG TPA: tRNA 2-thiouridine(34) synthase MnmA [Terriglobales bacterium]|nr:tRNA 2-thiouridine(34) synthase MnmA [Terriglobales bacterium]